MESNLYQIDSFLTFNELILLQGRQMASKYEEK